MRESNSPKAVFSEALLNLTNEAKSNAEVIAHDVLSFFQAIVPVLVWNFYKSRGIHTVWNASFMLFVNIVENTAKCFPD